MSETLRNAQTEKPSTGLELRNSEAQMLGVGALVGGTEAAALGAVAGTAIAGPLGLMLGGAIGTAVGALVGGAVGLELEHAFVHPKNEEPPAE